MAGLGQYAGSFASGFGQRMDYWREEDKKLSKQHKDAVDAIHQFARNNPYATQKDLENYASKSGVPDWQNVLGKGGYERLANHLQQERDYKRTTRENAATTFANQLTTFDQSQDKYFTELKLQEHEIFKKEMDRRLGASPFLKIPMSEDKIGEIATATAKFLSGRHPQLNFDEVRELYDYKSRLQQRAQNRQDKATAAARLIETMIAENPSKYSQPGEIEKLRKEVREANRFGPEVELISDERARQIQAAASEAQATVNFENQTQMRQKLHALLQKHSLSWTEADTQLDGRAWEDAKQVLRDMGIDEAKQEVFLSAFNPTRLKQEAEEAWLSSKSTQISNLAKQYRTVEELMVGLGARGYQLSQRTTDWLDGQIKANAHARRQNREKYIIEEIAFQFGNVRDTYHNVMRGDTEDFEAWRAEINNAKGSAWGEISMKEILQAIYRVEIKTLQTELKAAKQIMINNNGYDSSVDLNTTGRSEAIAQQLNKLQEELIYSVIDHDLIHHSGSVSALAEYIRKNNILADPTQQVNLYTQATKLMARIMADPNNSAVLIAQTPEEKNRLEQWKQYEIAGGLLDNPGGHISDLRKDINGDSKKPMFTGIQANLDNLVKHYQEGSWNIGDQRQALANLSKDKEKLRKQIRAEEVLLETYGSGLSQKHYTEMLGLIKNAQEMYVKITAQIDAAGGETGKKQGEVTDKSGLSVDTQSFDLNSFLSKIKTKADAMEEYRETAYRRDDIYRGTVSLGVQKARDQMEKDERFLKQLNNMIATYQAGRQMAGRPNVPLLEILGKEGVEEFKRVRDRDYNAIIDQSIISRKEVSSNSIFGDRGIYDRPIP